MRTSIIRTVTGSDLTGAARNASPLAAALLGLFTVVAAAQVLLASGAARRTGRLAA